MSSWDDLLAHYRVREEVSTPLKIATVAQWLLESGRGTSLLARDHLNFGGLKFRQRMVGYAEPVDYRGGDGELTTYCKFATVDDFVEGYWHFISAGPYEGYDQYENDGAAYIRHIANKGYSVDPSYVSKVLALFGEAADLLGIKAELNRLRLAVIVGHNPKKTGAVAVSPLNTNEFKFNSRIAKILEAQAESHNMDLKVFFREPKGSYTKEIKDTYGQVKKWGADCAVELHFNSADYPTASRSEVLCREDSADARALAKACVDSVEALLQLKNGGAVPVKRTDRGGEALYVLDEVPTVLIEPFFGSNSSDCARVKAVGLEALALAYLRGVRNWDAAKVA